VKELTMVEEENLYDEMPLVYKKDKATIILLLDGLFDLSIGIFYFFFFRRNIYTLTKPIQEVGFVNFNIMLFFDVILFLELVMAVFELIAVYFIKFTENKQIPKLIKRMFIISHIILLPLGGLIGLVIDLILM